MDDQRIRLLLVDDNETFVQFATRFIEQDPALQVIGTASDGDEAVAQARALEPDVILLDLSMPRRGGLHAIDELVQVAPHAAIVVVTSMDPALYEARVLASGAFAFVAKVQLTSELIPTIYGAADALPRRAT